MPNPRPARAKRKRYKSVTAMVNAVSGKPFKEKWAIHLVEQKNVALRREIADWKKSFAVYHDAEMRGVKLWRSGNPGNEHMLPDKGKMTAWLLERMSRLEAECTRLREALQEHTNSVGTIFKGNKAVHYIYCKVCSTYWTSDCTDRFKHKSECVFADTATRAAGETQPTTETGRK